MEWVSLFYDACMLSTLAYAWWRGGSAERWAAAVNVVASVLSWAIAPAHGQGFHRPEIPMWTVDVLAVAAFMGIMFRSPHHWPMWASACALNGACVTGARFFISAVHYRTYFATEAVWPVGVMLAINFGTAARAHPRLAEKLSSPFSARSIRRMLMR
jgi:hypothetical protein